MLSITSITKFEIWGGYPRSNMVIHGAWSDFHVQFMVKFSPNHSFTPQFTYRWLTHIVSAVASTRLTPIHQCALLKYSTHITFLHHLTTLTSRAQVYFRDLTCE